MFEHFTEKAVNAVIESQKIAQKYSSPEVTSEHLLMALVVGAKGVSLKIFRMYGMTEASVAESISEYIIKAPVKNSNLPFSYGVKTLLKNTLDLASKSGNRNVLFEHLFLSLISATDSNIQKILSRFSFDIKSVQNILAELVQRKIKRLEHPEGETEDESNKSFEAIYGNEILTGIFDNAASKLSASGYEILGTEQIMSSILEDKNSFVVETANKCGLNIESFEEKLAVIPTRSSEYEGKKYIFTPNAFLIMNYAIQYAKEFGSSAVLPEHVVLGILKAKRGLAYDVIKSLNISVECLQQEIMKPIEKQMPETLMIMKIAKEEARRLGRNVIGTEMLLLGILGEGASDGYEVLKQLEITLKDARIIVEDFVGYGNEYFDEEMVFSKRAKKILEKAWLMAQKTNKQKIEATDLLYAITTEPEALAMKVLNTLGVDVVEIKHGISGIK